MRWAWAGALNAVIDEAAMRAKFGFMSWREVRDKDLQGAGGSMEQLAVLVAEAQRVKESASKRLLQSLFTGASICGVSAYSNFSSSFGLWAQSAGVSPNVTYLLVGFVKSFRLWMFGERCPVSPAVWSFLMSTNHCVHWCQWEINTGICSTAPFLIRDTYPRRESSNKFKGKLQQLKLILFFLLLSHPLCYLKRSVSEVVKQGFFNYTSSSKLIKQTKQATK